MEVSLQTNKIFDILTDSDKRITVMQGGSRCFTGDIEVNTENGRQPIKDVAIGTLVDCVDNAGNVTKRRVVDKFMYEGVHKRHKVVTFVLSDGQKITCTYGHKLLQQNGYVEAVDIARGIVEAGGWECFELFRQHRGKVGHNGLQNEERCGCGKDYESCVGCEWVYEDYDNHKRQVKNHQVAQSSCGGVFAESGTEASSESHQQRQSGQQSLQSRVGYIQREFRPYDEARKTNLQQWREEWQEYSYSRYCKADQVGVQAVCSDDERFGSEVWGEKVYHKGYTDGQELGKCLLDASFIDEIIFHTTSETVYDIEVEEFHNYLITDRRIVSHNSGKTYNILIWFIIKLLQEDGKTLTIVRQSLPSIKGTVLRDFIDILSRMEIYSEDNHNKTDQIYSLNGNIIEFVSADQPQKIRGRARDYLFCNEANELTYEAWMQLIMRTSGKIVIDYNPSDLSSWIYDDVIPRTDADFYITTFRDNPFLPPELIAELERLKDADPNYWQIYGLGERGLSQDLIYSHWRTTEQMVDDDEGEVVYGLDFGFNVPTALVKVVFHEGNAYCKEMLYETKLTTEDLVDRLKALNISPYDDLYCDAAEPKTIEALVRSGFNAKPANKDVTEGIRTVKATPLFILNESVNLLKEIKNYRWKTDRNGNKLDMPVKFGDHILDALRYGIYSKITIPKVTWGAI